MKMREIFSLKEKDNILMQVKINNNNSDMQMDTGSKVTLIARKYLGKTRKDLSTALTV